MPNSEPDKPISATSWMDRLILFCLQKKVIVFLLLVLVVVWGIMAAPFDWQIGDLPRDPVPVDAIPDIGENQQIVFTEWPGRSPQDMEDQITYPLTASLLGLPGVKTVRSQSMMGFSTIYVIFEDDVEFYWSRDRVLEKLSSLPTDSLPAGVSPRLGPDATALGQVFWYTLEGRDAQGNPTGGWDLHELRAIQDWQVRYALQSVQGISEVASVGGFVQEYQVDVDPDAMRVAGVALEEVTAAVKMCNLDVGARTIEVNKVEYVIRGLGFVKQLQDIENAVIKVNDNVPIYVKDVAHVTLGPALRRGGLDDAGAEAVGGVVVVRFGENPLAAIKRVKDKIAEITPGLPKKTLPDGTASQVQIVPFYDRTGLIHETLDTLHNALTEEILVTIIVVMLMMVHLRSSLLISALLPMAVLMCFIAMKAFAVDANIVALSGIAIAIGTMVDMGIIVCENIVKHMDLADEQEDRLLVVYRATREVGGAVLTAVATTIVGFLPVFTMQAAEGKLFRTLAFTKTFALVASVIVALTVLPPVAQLLFARRRQMKHTYRYIVGIGLFAGGITAAIFGHFWLGLLHVAIGLYICTKRWIPARIQAYTPWVTTILAVVFVGSLLSEHWLPLGPEKGFIRNFVFIAMLIGGLLLLFYLLLRLYTRILTWCLGHKRTFLLIPAVLVFLGIMVWVGFEPILGWLPNSIKASRPVSFVAHKFPGLGKEFMPSLDEGAFLYMPTTMPHASIGEVMDVLQKQDVAISQIPEVERVVGKLGRAQTPLDPAPVSMIETIITYKPKYGTDEEGDVVRQWRPEIETPDDIWKEIVKAAQMPGSTSAPKLQPIETRIIMLQSGMRAPMGIKVKGPDLETIEAVGLQLERLLKQVPQVNASSVFADRIVGKPYLEITIDREAIARYGIKLGRVQEVIQTAIGGKTVTTTVEGRARFGVRIRYMRELRDSLESLERIIVPAPRGEQIPLIQLARIDYVRGPQMIKSEDSSLVGYVFFDGSEGYAEVGVVERARAYLEAKIAGGELDLPAGVSYRFAGTFENQVRAEKRLMVILPLTLLIIFVILYLRFSAVSTTLLVFSGIIVAWAGGFIMIWFYAQPWFLDFSVFGMSMRELFQVHSINLSVAVWVGFLALFGIASDDGVVIATYIKQTLDANKPTTRSAIRQSIIEAGRRRARPCLMTTATTVLALLPVLTSVGRGSDIMVPMAIPTFGGMTVVMVSMFVVPVLYCALAEAKAGKTENNPSEK